MVNDVTFRIYYQLILKPRKCIVAYSYYAIFIFKQAWNMKWPTDVQYDFKMHNAYTSTSLCIVARFEYMWRHGVRDNR